MVVIDRLTKYAHFIGLQHPYSAKTIAQTVAQVFLDHVYKLHCMPTVISDRDPLFTSQFWQEVFKLQKVSLNLSIAYHPQSDGQTEVVWPNIGIIQHTILPLKCLLLRLFTGTLLYCTFLIFLRIPI